MAVTMRQWPFCHRPSAGPCAATMRPLASSVTCSYGSALVWPGRSCARNRFSPGSTSPRCVGLRTHRLPSRAWCKWSHGPSGNFNAAPRCVVLPFCIRHKSLSHPYHSTPPGPASTLQIAAPSRCACSATQLSAAVRRNRNAPARSAVTIWSGARAVNTVPILCENPITGAGG